MSADFLMSSDCCQSSKMHGWALEEKKKTNPNSSGIIYILEILKKPQVPYNV